MGILSTRAVLCTAHLLLQQNPGARVAIHDWVPYLALVKAWCEAQAIDGVRYYFEPEFIPVFWRDSSETLQ